MSYIKPEKVISPQKRLYDVQVVFDGGDASWSVAKIKWDGKDAVGLRWNGSNHGKGPFPNNGNPQSRGYPTWIVLPDGIDQLVLKYVKKL